jgi:hypothetical protein
MIRLLHVHAGHTDLICCSICSRNSSRFPATVVTLVCSTLCCGNGERPRWSPRARPSEGYANHQSTEKSRFSLDKNYMFWVKWQWRIVDSQFSKNQTHSQRNWKSRSTDSLNSVSKFMWRAPISCRHGDIGLLQIVFQLLNSIFDKFLVGSQLDYFSKCEFNDILYCLLINWPDLCSRPLFPSSVLCHIFVYACFHVYDSYNKE